MRASPKAAHPAKASMPFIAGHQVEHTAFESPPALNQAAAVYGLR